MEELLDGMNGRFLYKAIRYKSMCREDKTPGMHPISIGCGEVGASEEAVRCADCGGHGEVNYKSCPACGGTGWTPPGKI